MMKTLSIVVSVYNEAKALDNFFSAFEDVKNNLTWDYELIFINDGSTDSSLDILKEYSKRNNKAKVISFSRNYGHEAAMIAGIDHSIGDGVVCLDADLQHPLECIPQIIEKFESGFDVISMVRKKNESAGIIKNITSKMFYRLINLISSDAHFAENASDFFGVSRCVADTLKNEFRERIRFLRGYVQYVGFNKTVLEYEAAERSAGRSHYSIKNLIRLSTNTILCFSEFPLKLGTYAGMFSAFLGLVMLVYSLFTHKGAPDGYSTLIAFNSFMFSVLFLLIGILGQYISVMLSEVKSRPIYLIQEKINFENETDD